MKIGNQRGLTLLELLLSIVILGIISTCVISVALTSTRVSSRTNESLFSANITYNIHELWLDHTFNDTYPSYESFFNTLAMFYDAENLASDDALSGLDSPLSVDSGSFSLQPFDPDPGLARAVYKTSSADPLVGNHVFLGCLVTMLLWRQHRFLCRCHPILLRNVCYRYFRENFLLYHSRLDFRK